MKFWIEQIVASCSHLINSDFQELDSDTYYITPEKHSVLNQGFLYTNFNFFYKTSQTVLLVLTFIDMMFEQEAVPVS